MQHLLQTEEDALTAKHNEKKRLKEQSELFAEQRRNLAELIASHRELKEKLQAREQRLTERRQQTEKQITEMRLSEKDLSIDRERSKQRVERVREQPNYKPQGYDEIIKHLYDEYGLTRSEASRSDFYIII